MSKPDLTRYRRPKTEWETIAYGSMVPDDTLQQIHDAWQTFRSIPVEEEGLDRIASVYYAKAIGLLDGLVNDE